MTVSVAQLSTAQRARMLAAVGDLRKAKVDPEKLRAQLMRLFRLRFMQGGRAAIAEAISAVRGMEGPVDAAEAEVVMQQLETSLGVENLGTTLVGQSATVVRDVFEIAAKGVKSGYKLTVTDHRAINTIARHDLVWIKDHNENNLMPKLRQATTDVMREGYSRDKLAQRLADDLGGIVDADAKYWSDLADHTTTKAREIGRVQGFVAAGITRVIVRARMDSRTSEMCRSMNGRVIAVEHLVRQRDEILAAKTTSDMKNAAQFAGSQGNLTSFEGKTGALPANIGLPPYHYKCRTTLFAESEKPSVSKQLGSDVSSEDAAILDRYSAEEHFHRAAHIRRDAARPQGLEWGKDLESDQWTHGARQFEEKRAAYKARANASVVGADEVVAQVYQGKTQYVFFCERRRALSVVDDNGSLRGCYRVGHVEKHIENYGREAAWLKTN